MPLNFLSEIQAFNDWLALNPTVTSDDIVLWHTLMQLNNQGRWQTEFTVAISTIIDRSRLSRSAIYRSRNRLSQLGRIKTKERPGNQCSAYQIVPFVFPNGTQTGEDTGAVFPNGTHSGTQPGTQSGTQAGTIIKTKQDKTKKEANASSRDFDFAAFWDAYGKKADKTKCEKAWSRISEADKALIMERLPAYVVSTPELRYRKNPLTWLNGQCWNDEMAPASSPPGKRRVIMRAKPFGNEEEWTEEEYERLKNITEYTFLRYED